MNDVLQTERRVTLLRQYWPTATQTTWIVDEFNKLPGRKGNSAQITNLANRLGLTRSPAASLELKQSSYRSLTDVVTFKLDVVSKQHMGGPDSPLEGKCQYARGASPRWDFCTNDTAKGKVYCVDCLAHMRKPKQY